MELQLDIGCLGSVNIWHETICYDELTMNERQMNNTQFSSMLDSVRCGEFSNDVEQCLMEHVISVSVVEKFQELQEAGNLLCAYFPHENYVIN